MILVTGANGFVGHKIMELCEDAVAAPSLRNVTQEAMKRIIEESNADVIIHTAAISDIGSCQADPEASYYANVEIPLFIAKASKGRKLVCFSSDQVYSGCSEEGPYLENLENPCRAASIPYWKAACTAVPENMKILHDREFCPELLERYLDEPYFRLLHHLQGVEPVSVPDGYSLYKADASDFAEHINKCYEGISPSVPEIQSYISRSVYCPELWLAVKDDNTGEIVATGIAELDREIGEGVLEWIQVSRDYRRCGLGRYIVLELLFRMRNKARFVTVSGQCHSPDKPEELYRKCGFCGNDVWHILRERA